ncbi:hypothetical protein EYR36_007161 [Pleurotus pulmonarius]|nr:hypothetical protein EYR36_007161 [Pleurotus pulmonarius]
MAHSTTTTASHILTKYSKCYVPAHSPTQSSQTDGAGEWQHFVNPVLELVLDIKKSRLNNELESVRLRILWNMDTSGVKNEVLFEDLDLLAYSNIPTSGQPIPGLPLKAVYRDAVVGIRYLYPIIATPDAQPVLRPTSASASRFSRVFLVYARLFVDFKSLLPRPTQHSSSSMRYATSVPAKSILYLVPRQSFTGSAPRRGVGSRIPASFRPLPTSNAAEGPRLIGSDTSNNIASIPDLTVTASQPSLPSEDSQSHLSSTRPPISPVRVPSSDDLRGSSSTLGSTTDLADIRPMHPPSSTSQEPGVVQLPPSRNNSSDDVRNRDGPPCVGWATETSSSLEEPRATATTSSIQARSIHGGLYGSTPPCSGVSDISMPPPRLPWQNSASDASSLLSAVRESTKLYDLSSCELEDLVGRVVCEEGFSKLVCFSFDSGRKY